MVEIIVNQKNTERTRYSFDSGTITIGRGSANELHLNSPTVSDKHARVSLFDDNCVIQSLVPGGAVFVNGSEIEKARLYDQDVIQIGPYKLNIRGDELVRNTVEPAPLDGGATEVESDVHDALDPPELEAGPDEATIGSGLKDRPEQTAPAAEREPDAEQATPGDLDQSPAPEIMGTFSTFDDGAPKMDDSNGAAALSIEERNLAEEQRLAKVRDTLPKVSLISTGVDVLSGPAKGKRIIFTGKCARLGIKDDTAATIRPSQHGYMVSASNHYIVVTLNGKRLTDKPEPLSHGDLIEFSELKARFYVGPD